MNINDEILMAFADGELDAAAIADVEAAMRGDPSIEQRVAEHRALRARLQRVYAPPLAEAVPERLLAAARGSHSMVQGNVVDLQRARAASGRATPVQNPSRFRWRPLGAMAASVLIGLVVGHFLWHGGESALMRTAGGAVVAQGQLASALSSQLAAEQSPGAAVRIGVSYLAKSGDYCRTFSLSGELSPAGLACRRGTEWQIQMLTQESGGAGMPQYRTAASSMSPAVLAAVESTIAGEPLDSAGEVAARHDGWKK